MTNKKGFSDNFRALKQKVSRKDLLPMTAFLSAKAFPVKIIREGKKVLTFKEYSKYGLMTEQK
jgi:hypothetical protein